MTTRAITFYGTTLGMKVAMAVSGLIGIGFLVGHMLGNLLVYAGPEKINGYSATLHQNPEFVWVARLVLITAITVHVHAAFSLWGRNSAARPRGYAMRKDQATDYAARTMRHGGLVLIAFITYHLWHLTLGQTSHLGYEFDKHDVYNNVVLGFGHPLVACFYILAQIALGMHLYHGTWSLSQTLGAEHPRYNRLRQTAAAVLTLVIISGFVSIPISVQLGILEPTAASEAIDADAAE